MTVRLVSVPEWAEKCLVEPISTLGRDALTLPRYKFYLTDGIADDFGLTLSADGSLYCAVEQPILDPALDCPVQVRLIGGGQEQLIEVAYGGRPRLLSPIPPGLAADPQLAVRVSGHDVSWVIAGAGCEVLGALR